MGRGRGEGAVAEPPAGRPLPARARAELNAASSALTAYAFEGLGELLEPWLGEDEQMAEAREQLHRAHFDTLALQAKAESGEPAEAKRAAAGLSRLHRLQPPEPPHLDFEAYRQLSGADRIEEGDLDEGRAEAELLLAAAKEALADLHERFIPESVMAEVEAELFTRQLTVALVMLRRQRGEDLALAGEVLFQQSEPEPVDSSLAEIGIRI